MKQVLDCAILHFGQQLDPGAVTQLSEVQHKLKHRRLRCHELDLSERLMISDELLFREDDRQFLLMQLLRYDVAVFILSTETLSLARRFLFYLHCAEELNKGFCPMIALATGVQSVAMIDLMRLGLSDFMHSPVDHDELRVRLFASVNKPLLRLPTESEVVDPPRQSSSATAMSKWPVEGVRQFCMVCCVMSSSKQVIMPLLLATAKRFILLRVLRKLSKMWLIVLSTAI